MFLQSSFCQKILDSSNIIPNTKSLSVALCTENTFLATLDPFDLFPFKINFLVYSLNLLELKHGTYKMVNH